jgi:hypothetical protein
MSKIFVEKFDDNVLRAGDICYALYKKYPGGFKFFIGHFRSAYDYEAEAEWLDAHEKDPKPASYIAEEESDWKLEDICDSAKYAAHLDLVARDRWEKVKQAAKAYDDWKAGLVAMRIEEHDLPLSKRLMPPLFAEPTFADMYYSVIRDNKMFEPKWAAYKKRLNELVDKACQEEWKKVTEDMARVRPLSTKEGMYFQLRYLHNGQPVAKDSAINFARSLDQR